jgi:chromosome segregation ATPase
LFVLFLLIFCCFLSSLFVLCFFFCFFFVYLFCQAADVMKATAESKIRQLNNEVDFLRAQLTSESTCRSDLESSLREVTVRFQDAKEKWTTTIRDMEESKRRETRELEERFRQEMIAPREQIKRLEDKLQNTQRQLTEMVKDLQMSQDKMNATDSAKRVSVYCCALSSLSPSDGTSRHRD